MVIRCTIHNVPEVHCFFSLISCFGLDPFLNIKEDVYNEAVNLFYANLVCPEVPEVTQPITRSHLLKTPIDFSLSTFSEILELPNKGDHVFLSAHSKTKSNVFFSKSPLMVRKPPLLPPLNQIIESFPNGLLGILSFEEVSKTFSTPYRPYSCMPSLLIGNLMWAT